MRVSLPEPFVNPAGVIQNIVVSEVGFRTATIIHSARDSVRANHYHRTDDHYTYVLSGSVVYAEREINSVRLDMTTAPEFFQAASQLYRAGECFYTPPRKEHVMVFLEPTTLLTLAKNLKDHAHHEADVIRTNWCPPVVAVDAARHTWARFVASGLGGK